MSYTVPPLETLIDKLASLPSIGRKSAQRIAFYLLDLKDDEINSFVDAINQAHTKIHCCSVCQTLTDSDVCSICASDGRDKSTICVVESPQDIMAIERTREYNGGYHVLHGLISPIDGIDPERLKIKELLHRITDNDIEEVIMATNPTVEGEATAVYIARLLKPFNIKVTRLAYGIPVGGSLEYSDDITLLRALEGRSILE